MPLADRDSLEISSRATWRSWLTINHDASPGIWVVTYKKSSGLESLTYEELIQEALCFGWVDSLVGRVDELRTKTYFSPRKRRSRWAVSNKRRVDALIVAGLMTPAGISVIAQAKANGSWNKLDDSEAIAQGLDGYQDPESGLFVFTSAYHLRRGTCCDSGCRHCPYR